MKPLLFYVAVGVLFVFIILENNNKEGNFPISAFLASLGAVVSIVLIDRWWHPEIYQQRKKPEQKDLS